MQRLFSRIIEQRTYVEQPQGFEVYQEETFVWRWKKTTWWRTSNAQQKRGEKLSITEILYQNGYSEAQDDGFLIHDKPS
jgi:hypothetical protein